LRSVLVFAVTIALLVLNAMGPRRTPTFVPSPKPRHHRNPPCASRRGPGALGTADDYPALARFLRSQSPAQSTTFVSTR
jgi:hypothetical protein